MRDRDLDPRELVIDLGDLPDCGPAPEACCEEVREEAEEVEGADLSSGRGLPSARRCPSDGSNTGAASVVSEMCRSPDIHLKAPI